MANYSVTAIIVFIVITLLYFIASVLIPNKNVSNVLTAIYYLLIFGSQIGIVLIATKQRCGSYMLGTTLQYGIIPWLVIFGGFVTFLHFFPGWKAPFSNTFGYFVTYLMGVKTIFNKLLKSDFKSSDPKLNKIMQDVYQDKAMLINESTPNNFEKIAQVQRGGADVLLNESSNKLLKPDFESSDLKLNKIMQDVYQDKAMLINEFTPNNFEKAINDLAPIMNSDVVQNNKVNWRNDALKTLEKLVVVKDEVSRFIWYVLIGTLITSMSNLGIMSHSCNYSVQQMESDIDKGIDTAMLEVGKKIGSMTYNVRD